MTICAAQVVIPRVNDIPQDAIVNVWHFRTVGATSAEAAAADFDTAITAFYVGMQSLYSNQMVKTPITVKYYDLSHAKPRAPILTSPLVWAPGSGTPWPAELACCLSYKADYASGFPSARRRGRIYIGPLTSDTASIDEGDVRFSGSTRQTFQVRAGTLLATSLASATFRWVVFSPTTFGDVVSGGGDFADYDVTSGWIDNAVDVQRRRGADPTARTVFPVPA